MVTRSILAAMFLAACSSSAAVAPAGDPPTDAGGGAPVDAGSPSNDAGDAGPATLDLRHEGAFARKVLSAGDGAGTGALLVLYDTPLHLKERWGRPARLVARVTADGKESALYTPTNGHSLIDVAVHPSGDWTALEAGTEGWQLLRFTALGRLRGATRIDDPEIATDLPAMSPAESTSPIETTTWDAGRLAADGEEVFVATRTGRHSVIAYRWAWDVTEFARKSRTLIVPAFSIAATGLHGGSYDTFNQLEAHYGVFVGVDGAHLGYVGVSHVRLDSGNMVKAHKAVFGETLITDPDYLDAYVTRVDAAGQRLGTSVISTPDDEQLYELKSTADGVFALGRSEHWNAQGTGFDALAAHVDAAGTVVIHRFDVDRGDIAFDALAEPDGSFIVVGASGYAQNPNGASIVEDSEAFARRVRADGTTEALALPQGPRHNEARSVLRQDGAVVVGGMTDGPGTHSADRDRTALRATGWVKQLAAPRVPRGILASSE